MTNNTIGRDTSINGSGASRAADAADIFSDLAALRLLADETGQIGSEEVLAHVPVRRPTVSQRPLECDGIRVVSVKTGIAPVLQVYRAANDALACAPGWKGILSVCTHPPCSARGCGNAGRLWQQMLLTTFRQ